MALPPRIPKVGLAGHHSGSRRETRPAHLSFLRTLECPVYPDRRPLEAHHLLRADKSRGMGRRAADRFAIPLSRKAHRELHGAGDEEAWLASNGIDGRALAAALWRVSGDRDAALKSFGERSWPAATRLPGAGRVVARRSLQLKKDTDRPGGHQSYTVIPGGKTSARGDGASSTLRVLTCRVCEARDGVDSWGAIILVKPCTDGDRVVASHQLLLCATCFQKGIRTYLGPAGAYEL